MEISFLVYNAIAALAAGLAVWVLLMRFIVPERNKRELETSIRRIQEIYRIMDEVLDSTDAKRFMIKKTENGGGKPNPGSRLYASVIHSAQRPPFQDKAQDYQRLRIDREYIDVLADVARHGQIYLDVRDMPNCLLRRIYESEGVRWVRFFYLHGTKNAFFYATIATDADDGLMRTKEVVQIEIAINKLRNIFKKIN